MEIIYAAIAGFILDLLAGDPARMPHPVVYMGKAIAALEKTLRRRFGTDEGSERRAGLVLAAVLPAGVFTASYIVLELCALIHPALKFLAEVIWSWQVLALKDLRQESMAVYDRLKNGTLEEARTAVSRIVGRDTQKLSAEGVTRAAVETVAESFSDGEIAPLFWFLIGGAPLALCYKAINTMDSMVGYKNEKYINFGRAAAKLDDAANLLPSRISALLLIAVSGICGADRKNAIKIWRRDRLRHASPNSAQTESVVAGALEIQLAGPAYYFGEYYDKATIGDPLRPIEAEDIRRANRMNYFGAVLGLTVFCAVRAGIIFIVRCI